MAPKKQQTSINIFLKKRRIVQFNLIVIELRKQSKQAFQQSVQQRISNLQQELKQHRQKIEKIETTLDELQQRIDYDFSVVEQTINQIQQQMGDKFNQITQHFQDIPQFFQSDLKIPHQQIKQLQEQQTQQLEFNKNFMVQTQSIPLDIEPNADLQFVNRISQQIRRSRY